MLRFIKIIIRILFSLNRIATALETLAGIAEPIKLQQKDFKGYTITEEELIEQEDLELNKLMTNRLIKLESEGKRNFFIEDDIRDILEEVNET